MTENLELREWIAVNVMGLKVRVIKNDDSFHAGEWVRCYGGGGSWSKDYLGDGGLVVDHENDMSREVPHYESEIAAAWLVVEAMRARGYWCNMHSPGVKADDGDKRRETWLVEFCKWVPYKATHIMDTKRAEAPTAPLAICLAAKAAIEGEG